MKARTASAVVMFDILYEDGSRSSNRKVPLSILGGLDGDEPARAAIEEQDRQIAAARGRDPVAIKSLSRTPIKVQVEEKAPLRRKR